MITRTTKFVCLRTVVGTIEKEASKRQVQIRSSFLTNLSSLSKYIILAPKEQQWKISALHSSILPAWLETVVSSASRRPATTRFVVIVLLCGVTKACYICSFLLTMSRQCVPEVCSSTSCANTSSSSTNADKSEERALVGTVSEWVEGKTVHSPTLLYCSVPLPVPEHHHHRR